jgi:hypothetical protein
LLSASCLLIGAAIKKTELEKALFIVAGSGFACPDGQFREQLTSGL